MDTQLILKNVSEEINLTKEETDYFVDLLHWKSVKKKEYLLRSGETCRYEYFIINGCLRSFYIDSEGTERLFSFSLENNWLFDDLSFWNQSPSILNFEAIEYSEILYIGKRELEKLFEQIPKFERYFRIIGNKIRTIQQKRIKQNLACNAEERLIDFREDYPGLELRIPQKYIASYLGVTPEFLSSLRNKLA